MSKILVNNRFMFLGRFSFIVNILDVENYAIKIFIILKAKIE